MWRSAVMPCVKSLPDKNRWLGDVSRRLLRRYKMVADLKSIIPKGEVMILCGQSLRGGLLGSKLLPHRWKRRSRTYLNRFNPIH